jgi:hypothetical protein
MEFQGSAGWISINSGSRALKSHRASAGVSGPAMQT